MGKSYLYVRCRVMFVKFSSDFDVRMGFGSGGNSILPEVAVTYLPV
jgi:hypothetical protein